jgi:sterol carrier protein 2
MAGKRQVKNAKVALQHNLGLGGAVIVSLYRHGFPEARVDSRQLQAAQTSSSTENDFKSASVFSDINKALEKDGANIVKKVNGVFCFKVKGPADQEAVWVVDAKNGSGAVKFNSEDKADTTIAIGDSDLFDLMTGKLNPQTAFFQGKLKITGNMGLAMKLKDIQPKSGSKL